MFHIFKGTKEYMVKSPFPFLAPQPPGLPSVFWVYPSRKSYSYPLIDLKKAQRDISK